MSQSRKSHSDKNSAGFAATGPLEEVFHDILSDPTISCSFLREHIAREKAEQKLAEEKQAARKREAKKKRREKTKQIKKAARLAELNLEEEKRQHETTVRQKREEKKPKSRH